MEADSTLRKLLSPATIYEIPDSILRAKDSAIRLNGWAGKIQEQNRPLLRVLAEMIIFHLVLVIPGSDQRTVDIVRSTYGL